jgi:hypothetical protein
MISVDHPNPKCLKLPEIITQTIKVPVILFSEGTNQNGINALRNSAHPYILYPPVSGPAIERMMLKIERDRNGIAVGEDHGNFESSREKINVSGSGPESFEIKSKAYCLEDIVRLFEGNGSLARVDEEGLRFSSDKAASETANDQSGTATLDTSENGDRFSMAEDLPELPVSLRRSQQARAKSLSPTTTSMLVRGAEYALEKTAIAKNISMRTRNSIDYCSRVGCFEIRTAYFRGYMIVAFGADCEIDENFINNIKENLNTYLKKNGVAISENELIKLRLNEVCFEDWSLREASFLRTAVHNEKEIGVAFFPFPEKDIAVELSAEAHMAKIKLSEIRPAVKLEFEIYLYLPHNRKYVRYANKSSILPEDKRARLIARGVNEVHIRKAAERDVIRYQVQNFLNDTIEAYKNCPL